MALPVLPGTGDVVAGHLIVRRVGVGSMGVVYEALDPDRQVVALKLLKPEKASDRRTLREFRQEAEATGAVDHENVVTVLGQGSADGFHFIRMELVDGPPLSRILKKRVWLPWPEALDLVVQVARGLGHAHERGIIHRDVKPDNVLVAWDGRVRLTDFGIAKDIGTLKGYLVKGRKVGTPEYASPEQCLGKRLDPATDMYSLGATLYHMVTGRYPFPGDSPQVIMRQHVEAEIESPCEVVPTIPKPLGNAIERMMAKRQTDRPPSMARLLEDLALIREGKVVIGAGRPRRR